MTGICRQQVNGLALDQFDNVIAVCHRAHNDDIPRADRVISAGAYTFANSLNAFLQSLAK